MIPYKTENLFNPTAYSDARYNSYVGDLFDRFIENRMTSDFAVENILKEAEDAFFEKLDDAKAPLGTWRGEFWGKLIISACRAAKYTGDEGLKSIIKKSCEKIISSADESGYIGSYKNPEMVLACPIEEGKKLMGWSCDWCWNIWSRKYTLWGLLESYDLLKDESILAAAVKSTDQLIDMLERLGIHICETGTFNGVASGSILKPILILYRLTENERYLNFALGIADSFQNDTVNCAKIIKNALAELPPHLWNCHNKPDPTSARDARSHKAYETMSCFDGILELYRITGDKAYLKASENFAELLMKYEFNPLMSVGFNDIFLFARSQQNAVSEPCDVIHFIRLLSELYKLTGKTSYLDTIELSFENALLSSMTRDAKWGARELRGISCHRLAPAQCELKYNHCCVNNIPRGMLNALELIAAERDNEVYINLYTPADITLLGNKISISEGYIQKQRVSVSVFSESGGKIKFRIPSWSATSFINGEPLSASGEYIKAALKAGENSFELEFDHTLQLSEPELDQNQYPLTGYMRMRYINNADSDPELLILKETKATLRIGAIILAKTRLLGSSFEEIFKSDSLYKKGCSLKAEPMENENVRAAFKITCQKEEEKFSFPAGDLAWSGNTYEEKTFSIFI